MVNDFNYRQAYRCIDIAMPRIDKGIEGKKTGSVLICSPSIFPNTLVSRDRGNKVVVCCVRHQISQAILITSPNHRLSIFHHQEIHLHFGLC